MTAILRAASPALASALAGGVPLWRADTFEIAPSDGTPIYSCTWDSDLTVAAQVYGSRRPWIEQTGWDVANTMEIPTLTLMLRDLDEGYAGGLNLKAQLHNGLLDGAAVLFSRAFMTSPSETEALGSLPISAGVVGPIDIVGTTATIQVKGKNNLLDQNVPRNLYTANCQHAFCDPGCTLLRATFTASFTVGANPTTSFIPWSGAPPGNATNYQLGTLAMTSGAAAGETADIAKADSTGLTLAYPLSELPAAGDGYTAFQGCDKSLNSGSGQSCTDRSNTQHFRGFPFIPPPNSAY
jgi:uncharacterized phage protein (TIGR02218 family)